jgi:hypothetical protein
MLGTGEACTGEGDGAAGDGEGDDKAGCGLLASCSRKGMRWLGAGTEVVLLPVVLALVSLGVWRQAQLTPLSELQGRPEASYVEGWVPEGQVGAVSQLAGVLVVVAVLPVVLVVPELPELVVVAVLPALLLLVLLPDRSGCCVCLQAQLTPLSQLQGRPEASYTEG